MIANKKSEYSRRRDSAYSFGGFAGGESVQSSRNLQKAQDAIISYVDLEAEIKALERERAEIIKSLEELPTLDYDFLFKFYAKGYSYKELAIHFDMSYAWAKKYRKKALEKLQALLDEKSTA
jgi:DNA-directed RNA polymerase specialized sigma24 family protein